MMMMINAGDRVTDGCFTGTVEQVEHPRYPDRCVVRWDETGFQTNLVRRDRLVAAEANRWPTDLRTDCCTDADPSCDNAYCYRAWRAYPDG